MTTEEIQAVVDAMDARAKAAKADRFAKAKTWALHNSTGMGVGGAVVFALMKFVF